MSKRRHDLLERLAAHVPADAREAEHVEAVGGLLNDASDPFDRSHYAPGHVTASAFVLSPRQDALLLILHGKLHRWLQPGGHVDASDPDVVLAARREVAEEVGLRDLELRGPLFDVDVHEIPAGREPAHRHFDVRFLFVSPTSEAQAGSDARAVRWVPLDQVGEVESDASVMRAVDKLRS